MQVPSVISALFGGASELFSSTIPIDFSTSFMTFVKPFLISELVNLKTTYPKF